MEFHNALVTIKKDPRDFEKIFAFLKLLLEESEPSTRAKGLLLLSDTILNECPLLSIKLLELSLRLFPDPTGAKKVIKALQLRTEAYVNNIEPRMTPNTLPKETFDHNDTDDRDKAQNKKVNNANDLIQAMIDDFQITEDLSALKSEFEGAFFAASTKSVHLNQFLCAIHFSHYILFTRKVKFSGGVIAWLNSKLTELRHDFKSKASLLNATEHDLVLVTTRFEELITPFDRRAN